MSAAKFSKALSIHVQSHYHQLPCDPWMAKVLRISMAHTQMSTYTHAPSVRSLMDGQGTMDIHGSYTDVHIYPRPLCQITHGWPRYYGYPWLIHRCPHIPTPPLSDHSWMAKVLRISMAHTQMSTYTHAPSVRSLMDGQGTMDIHGSYTDVHIYPCPLCQITHGWPRYYGYPWLIHRCPHIPTPPLSDHSWMAKVLRISMAHTQMSTYTHAPSVRSLMDGQGTKDIHGSYTDVHIYPRPLCQITHGWPRYYGYPWLIHRCPHIPMPPLSDHSWMAKVLWISMAHTQMSTYTHAPSVRSLMDGQGTKDIHGSYTDVHIYPRPLCQITHGWPRY